MLWLRNTTEMVFLYMACMFSSYIYIIHYLHDFRDLELKKKLDAKKDPQKEAECKTWIETVTGEKVGKDLEAGLKDGVILCKLVNVIRPGMVKSISTQKMPFMQMQNINNYLEACKKLGLQKHELFVTVDLFEGKNIPSVVDNLYALSAACMALKDWNGPCIGVKRSEKSEFNFTEEQLAQARNQPTMISEGSKGCASQAGMRDTSRDVIKTKDAGTRGEVNRLNEGGKGCASQAGMFDTSKNIVKTNDTGVRGEVSKLNEGSRGCASQAGQVDTSKDIVKVHYDTKDLQKKSGGGSHSNSDEQFEMLEKLAQLKDQGIITEEEFTSKKKKILGL